MSELAAVMDLLCGPVPRAGADFSTFWRDTAGLRRGFQEPMARAVALGFSADRLGFAFMGGYASALTRLDPSLGVDEVAALCATEDGGAHPRAIRAALSEGRLSGTKRFVSGGPFATRLLVVASEGATPEGRNRLRLVRVRPRAPGVTLEVQPELPFVPEVPHASVQFQDVAVAEADVFPGDGYTEALKPFRTLEDLHVHGALLGLLLSVARRSGWPQGSVEHLLTLVASALTLGGLDPRAPSTHLALAGLLSSTRAFLDASEAHWATVAPDEAARFERDRPLLAVAGKAREARRTNAWAALG
ncbi:MAG: acyl-CoA dehydrogenase family protein [Myxococcaceae bacterium]|nr:acyl-CoA dehydrogenase family protein [Myxococcaceae bacterium]